jgi:carbamoyl-phosphate synthase large subunit
LEIDLIVPTRDGELKKMIEIKNHFLEKNIKTKILVPESLEKLDTIVNKNKLSKAILDIFSSPKKYPEIKTVPLFVRHNYGSASNSIIHFKKQGQFELWLSESPSREEEYLIQEYLGAEDNWVEYSIDALYSLDYDNPQLVGYVSRIRNYVKNGESQITTVDQLDITLQLERLGKRLGLVGHNVIQIFRNTESNQMMMIEINPRFGGASNLSFQAGLNSPEILYKLLIKNQPLEPIKETIQIQNHLKMIRHSFDRFYLDGENYFYNQDNKKLIFCFDLDGTICSEKYQDYHKEEVLPKIGDKIRNLYQKGHQILIYTARGAKSGTDWKPLVEKQLSEWEIPYHQIITKKPFADFYIDNKGIDVLDF